MTDSMRFYEFEIGQNGLIMKTYVERKMDNAKVHICTKLILVTETYGEGMPVAKKKRK